MKKLFLVSFFKDTANLFADFESDLQGKTVTFIPTASLVERVVFYVSAAKKQFEKLGLVVDELEITTAPEEEIISKLKNNDFIYVAGGNTFYLLQELKRSGADKLIADEVNAGKLYIGESAGAMIAAANIEYVKAMDSVKKAPDLAEYTALNMVDFFPVPHHKCPPFVKSAQSILDNYAASLQLVPITNHDAIAVMGDKIEVIKG